MLLSPKDPAILAKIPYVSQSGQSSFRNLKPSAIKGWSGGKNEANIKKIKVRVQASSFQLWSDADIAASSQFPSFSILVLVASNFVSSTWLLSLAFCCLPSIQVFARLATGPIIAWNIGFSFFINNFIVSFFYNFKIISL